MNLDRELRAAAAQRIADLEDEAEYHASRLRAIRARVRVLRKTWNLPTDKDKKCSSQLRFR